MKSINYLTLQITYITREKKPTNQFRKHLGLLQNYLFAMFWRYCHDIMVSEDEMSKNKQTKKQGRPFLRFGFDKKANKIERRASHKISCGKN